MCLNPDLVSSRRIVRYSFYTRECHRNPFDDYMHKGIVIDILEKKTLKALYNDLLQLAYVQYNKRIRKKTPIAGENEFVVLVSAQENYNTTI